mgnify:CR=1 FL=1
MKRRRPPRAAPDVTRTAFPLVGVFLRGYLHEDWEADFETAVEARDAFLDDASAAERRAFAVECEALHVLTAALTLDEWLPVLHVRFGSAWQPASVDEVRQVLRPRR